MGGEFVLIGPNGWRIIGLVAIMALIGWWLSRKPGAPPPIIFLFFRALTWRLFPALRSWAEASKRKAVSHYAYDMSSTEGWEEDEAGDENVAATTATTQQQSIAMGTTDDNALLLQAKAEALAAMVEAGVVGETKGLQIVFNVRPSSTNPRYASARAALHAELDKRRGSTTPIAQRPTKARFV